jgi:hypothetical protein
MASDFTFDLTPPRRPSLDDLGGAAKQDDAAFPPDPVTMATAENWNNFAHSLEAYGKVLPFAVIEVRFALGVPFIANVQSLRSSLTAASFTAPVDNADGDTTISWASIANQFPPVNIQPSATLIGDGFYAYPTVDTTVVSTARVRTRDGNGSLIDIPFTLFVYGT